MRCETCGAPVEDGKCIYCGKFYNEVSKNLEINGTIERKKKVEILGGDPEVGENDYYLCKSCNALVPTYMSKCPKCGGKLQRPVIFEGRFWIGIVIAFIIFKLIF